MFPSSSDARPPSETDCYSQVSAVSSTESVSLGESACLINLCVLSRSSAPSRRSQPTTLLHHLHPHLPTSSSTRCPSGNHVNPKPIRGGGGRLDVGLGGQPAPLCSPAQWRMKLACGGPSVAVGHSRQPGSGAWPALHPLHHRRAPHNAPSLPQPRAPCQ